jgi:hypothetical protein
MASCTKEKVHERSHHRSARTFRHSPRDGVAAYSVLSPATGFLAAVIDINAEASSPI